MANDPLFPIPLSDTESLRSTINQQLAPAEIAITHQETCQLAKRREQCLFEAERIGSAPQQSRWLRGSLPNPTRWQIQTLRQRSLRFKAVFTRRGMN